MSTPTTALVFWLRDDPALDALVHDRIYQQMLPQSPDYPAVVLQTISEPSTYHLRGASGLVMTRVQIDCYAQHEGSSDGKSQVDDVAAAVDARLSGRRFATGGLLFRLASRLNRIDTYESAELQAFRVMLEFMVWTRPQ